MNQEQIRDLKQTISAVSAYYGRLLPDETIRLYVSDLSDLDFNQVMSAITIYRKNIINRSMFLPAHIIEIINPTPNSRDIALHTAGRIREAVAKFGWVSPDKAKEHIGNEGWAIVERMGGWLYICENLGVNLQETTFFAQLRDSLESQSKLVKSGIDTTQPVLTQNQQNKEQLALLMAKNNVKDI